MNVSKTLRNLPGSHHTQSPNQADAVREEEHLKTSIQGCPEMQLRGERQHSSILMQPAAGKGYFLLFVFQTNSSAYW